MIPQARPKRPFTKPQYPVTPREGDTQEHADALAVESRKWFYNRNQLSAGNNPVHFYKLNGKPFFMVHGPKCKNLKRARKSVLIYFRMLGLIPGAQVWQDPKDGQLLARVPVPEAEFAQIPLYPIEEY